MLEAVVILQVDYSIIAGSSEILNTKNKSIARSCPSQGRP